MFVLANKQAAYWPSSNHPPTPANTNFWACENPRAIALPRGGFLYHVTSHLLGYRLAQRGLGNFALIPLWVQRSFAVGLDLTY